MTKRRWLFGALALTAWVGTWTALKANMPTVANVQTATPALNCCEDLTCAPGCSPVCPPDCAPDCPPCPFCP
jgi:hypothetical protein